MPASKQTHVLAVLRKNLSLKQPELAKLVGCSAATIQAIELNKLSLSPGLAGRISAATGVDLDWLRANDLNQPLPSVRTLATQNKLVSQLIAEFKRLFTAASSIPRGSERDTLTLYLAWQLSQLKSGPPELTAAESAEADRAWEEYERLRAEAVDPALLDEVEQVAAEAVDPALPNSQKALPVPRKVSHRTRRSA